MKMNTKNVRKDKEAKLNQLRPVAAALKRLPELKEAAAKAQQEHSTFFNDPNRQPGDGPDKDRILKLHGAMARAIDEARNTEAAGLAAQREIRRIESSLNATADAERLANELKALSADGIAAEKRVLALQGVVGAITSEIDQGEAKATAARTEDAERAVQARLDGKPVPTVKVAPTGDSAKLQAERAAAQRQLASACTKLAEVAERVKELGASLLGAQARAIELDFEQAIEDLRPLAEYRAAINRVADTSHSDAQVNVDELEVQRLAKDIRAEHAVWTPTVAVSDVLPVDDEASSGTPEQAAA